MGKNVSNNTVVTACTARAKAIKAHLGAKDAIFVGGESMTPAALAHLYESALSSRAVAVTAKAKYMTALEERDADEVKRLAADEALRSYVVNRFGANSSEAHDFGFVPRKVSERSPAAKAKAALLSKATRDARGTMSDKKKKAIKGSLSPDVLQALEALSGSAAAAPAVASPAPSSSAPAAPSAPAANGASANGASANGASANGASANGASANGAGAPHS